MNVLVAGLGVMGRNHVRVLRELPEVDEVIGVDPDERARGEIAQRFRVQTFAQLGEALQTPIDAAVVATPARTHGAVVAELFARAIACLVEKPLAPTVSEANEIIAAAGDIVATVGHVERFNPAVIAMKQRLHLVGRVLEICTRRIGPYPARARDIGVRLDLLTHDADVVRFIASSDFRELAAIGGALLGPEEDVVHALGMLENGVIASMEVGWLSPMKVREIRVVGEKGTLLGDTMLQELHLHEVAMTDDSWEALATFRGIGEGDVTRYAIKREEPLRAELRSFLAAVRGEARVAVSLDDGLRAVQIAEALAPTAGPGIRVVRP